jgi:hypothetical protein
MRSFEENISQYSTLIIISTNCFSLGSSRSSWSCYFFPETSQECRDRAFELLGSEEAWKRGIITAKGNYSTKELWSSRWIPRQAAAYLTI